MPVNFSVDPDLCSSCGTCVLVCPKALLAQEDGVIKMIEGKEQLCNNCGQCAVYCPDFAITVGCEPGGELEETKIPTRDAYENVLQALKERRSYRFFSRMPVKQKDLERIFDVVRYAPSGGNNRFLRLIITQPETTEKFLELAAKWFEEDCRNDPTYGKRYASKIDSILERYREGEDPILRHAPHVIFSIGPKKAVWGAVESGINLIYFNLAAETMKIGCCFAGYATAVAQRSKEVRELLGINEEEECFCAMIFGYKMVRACRIPVRPAVKVEIIRL